MKLLNNINRRIAPVTIFLLLQAWFAAFALSNIGSFSSSGILSFLLFVMLLLCFYQIQELCANQVLPNGFFPATGLLSLLFTAFYVGAEHGTLTGSFDSGLFRLIYLVFTAAGLYFLFRNGVRLLMVLFSKISRRVKPCPLSVRMRILIFAGLLLCWLPWFLYNYPGVMTPDSISQFSQATGLKGYSSHHPPMHTLLIQLCYTVGYGLTKNVNAGIACYTIVQMLLLAGTESFCLSLLAKQGIPRFLLITWFCFWGLVPYNGIFAVTMWKDILFAAFMLLYAMQLFMLLKTPSLSFKKDRKLLLGLFFSGWLVCMFRSNGLYVFLFQLPFVLFICRKNLRLMGTVQIAILLLALLVKGPVCSALNVEEPHFTETLSIPLQQVARVVTAQRDLTEEQTDLINQAADITRIPDYYNPVISDPIKALVVYNGADYMESHMGDYFQLWLRLGLTYPGDYLEAFIDQTKGYWFPAPATLRTNEGISPNEIGLEWPKILRGMLPVKISEILLKLPDLLPVYGILWSIGAFTWAALFLMVFHFLYGDRKYLVLYLPFVGVILTLLLATPVASDIRYAYALILGMPFLLSVTIHSAAGGTQLTE